MSVIIPDMKLPNNCGECPLERILRAEYFEQTYEKVEGEQK